MGNYKQALAGLNDAQRQAVTTIDGPVLVIAGPGTGKTQLLSTRIAHILSTTDTLPESILCLTFTDSAAHNMRQRLSGMIGQAAYKVTISTYHAFGSDLIRRFPDYFAQEGDLEPIDDLGIDSTFREIIAALPYGNPLKSADTYLRDVKSFVSDAKRALLTPADIRAIAQANNAFLANAQPLVREALHDLARINKHTLALFENLHELLRDMAPADQLPAPGVKPLATVLLEELQDTIEAARESGKTVPLRIWKDTWLIKDDSGCFILDGERTNQKLLACADIYEQYCARLVKSRLFDYDDMILRALRGLQDHDDLRFTLQEQYQYLMLDEFQDTNSAQLHLVELLTNNPVSEGRPNVLAVGDDDQAIYAFQGADYSHMLQFQRMYRGVMVVPLAQNYRSHADILDTAAGIAKQITERLHHHFPKIQKTLVASNPTLPAKANIERHEAASEAAQCAWVTGKIQDLLAQGVPADEIAVLAPQHRYLEPILPFLQEANIPVRYEKRENVLDDPAIGQLVAMSKLCVSLANGETAGSNALWCEVLSFPFWRLPTSLIWQLSWQASDDDQNWTETLLQHEAVQPIALFFMRLSMLTRTETLESMVDYLTGTADLELQEPGQAPYTSPFYDYYFSTHDTPLVAEVGSFWSLLSNLTVLRERLRDYRKQDDTPLHLADFTQFVAAHRAADIKILNTSPHQNGDKAIQIMTAFKAKGMEFHSVFVLAATNEAWGTQARGQSSRVSLPQNLRYIRYAGASNDERLRLFYVALTRAKLGLYIINYTATFSGKATNRLQYLEENVIEGAVHSPLLPPGSQIVQTIENNARAEQAAELATYWHYRHQQSFGRKDGRALLQNRLERFQLSPTHVNAFTDVEYTGPSLFFMNTILRFPKAPTPHGQFGNAMHETLEWVHAQYKRQSAAPTLDDTLRIFDSRLRSKRLSIQDTTLMLERGRASLAAYLQQRRHTLGAQDVCEYNFRQEGVFVGEAHMAGKIDKLIIDNTARTITIVDFKTGKSYRTWERKAKLHKYQQQLYLYKALVERSSRFRGYTVADAYLEFIEPDDNGQIQELHLVFNPQEEARIQQLTERVWQRIQAVELPDINHYPPTLGGIEQFEKDLLG